MSGASRSLIASDCEEIELERFIEASGFEDVTEPDEISFVPDEGKLSNSLTCA
jgi:hypothetical protein